MSPTPIRQVLSTIQTSGTQALLMAGQACVLYGAAQFSKDLDFLILADAGNFRRLQTALDELQARRAFGPPFDPILLERGHAVHFCYHAAGLEGLRIDVLTRLRYMPPFETLWERRRVVEVSDGLELQVLSLMDLVESKKTQRSKDWPELDFLVAIHYQENRHSPKPEWIDFWLTEARTPEFLIELVNRFPAEATALVATRPPLTPALRGDFEEFRREIDAEIRAEQDKDRRYWEPLKREMEEFRRAERQG